MFTHILVPLDGSFMAESALPAAAYFADKLGARVTLLHVIEKNAPAEVHGQPHLKTEAEAVVYLKDVSRRIFSANVRVDCHVHATEVDNVAGSIVFHKAEFDHDLIIMCSHGRGRALHLLLGSIAQKVIALGTIPVLITHDGEDALPAFSCRSILAPMDSEAGHSGALPVVEGLSTGCGADIHLMTVVPDYGTLSGRRTVTSRFLPATTSKLLEMTVEHAAEYLNSLKETLRGRGIETSAHVLRGDPATAIVDAAHQSRPDLIVIATHGRSGMAALWEGSVAHRVCSQSRIPLLLIPIER